MSSNQLIHLVSSSRGDDPVSLIAVFIDDYHPHRIRHLAAVNVLRAGMGLFEVQLTLGIPNANVQNVSLSGHAAQAVSRPSPARCRWLLKWRRGS